VTTLLTDHAQFVRRQTMLARRAAVLASDPEIDSPDTLAPLMGDLAEEYLAWYAERGLAELSAMLMLTVRQPWAWAIARGYKLVENRVWTTKHRGLLGIHAAGKWDDHGEDALRFVRNALTEQGIPYPRTMRDELPYSGTSAVIAVANLVDICTAQLNDPDAHCGCGPWAMPGQAHWQLGDVRALATPIRASGAQQLWKWAIPTATWLAPTAAETRVGTR
jgi:hypothetical protein